MHIYTIYPLDLGTVTRSKSQIVGVKGDNGVIDIPILAYFVTDGERKIMIDTGGGQPDGRRYMPYTRSEEQSVVNQLGKIDILPKEIDTVIFTHLHWDHAGGNKEFTNAKFYAQERELHNAIAPLPIHKGSYDIKLIVETDYDVL
ncbi:MAG: MBL fold metallo-hydrolase, partial [Holosporales bacterium]|nr:MBL fold metallo-hydrolase [Holosporales bacterium]